VAEVDLSTEVFSLQSQNTPTLGQSLQRIRSRPLCFHNAVQNGGHTSSDCPDTSEAIITIHPPIPHRPPLHTTTLNSLLSPRTNNHPTLLLDERCPKAHRLLCKHLHKTLPLSTNHPGNNQHNAIPLPNRSQTPRRHQSRHHLSPRRRPIHGPPPCARSK